MHAFSFKRTASGPVDLLPPDETTPKAARRPLTRPEAVDAEFVVLSPERKPGAGASRRSAAGGGSNDNRPASGKDAAFSKPLFSQLAAGLAGAELALDRASRASFIGLVASLFILVFGLVGGFSFLSDDRAPQSTLSFSHVTVTPQHVAGMDILQLNGIVDNAGTATQAMRPIRADLIAEGSLIASIVIAPPADVVYAGHSRGFAAQLRYPGGEAPLVKLSFLD